jgi:hypothetical protein
MTPRFNHRILLVALVTAATGFMTLAARAGGDIVTDRPDISESSEVVGAGRFQIETSMAWQRNKLAGVRERLTTTPTLLRYGLDDTLELRIETEGYSRLRTDGGGGATTHSGMADMALGLKWHTRDGDEVNGQPSVAWLLHADLASGKTPFRGQGVRPSLRVVGEWELPDDWSVGVMPGLFVERNDLGKRYLGGLVAVTVGKAFSSAFRGYIELAAEQLAAPRNGGNSISMDGGVAYLLTPSMQVDASVKCGLSHAAPDASAALGFSVKF